MNTDDDAKSTLTDALVRRLKNIPVVARLLALAIVITPILVLIVQAKTIVSSESIDEVVVWIEKTVDLPTNPEKSSLCYFVGGERAGQVQTTDSLAIGNKCQDKDGHEGVVVRPTKSTLCLFTSGERKGEPPDNLGGSMTLIGTSCADNPGSMASTGIFVPPPTSVVCYFVGGEHVGQATEVPTPLPIGTGCHDDDAKSFGVIIPAQE
jgi:hypothetical protein